MSFTLVHEILVVLFFLPKDDGILRCHLDQHEPLARPLRDDDFLAQTFLRNLDVEIIRRADRKGTDKKPHAKDRDP